MIGFTSPISVNGRSSAVLVSSDDWSNVQDPVQRRRIQNRVAQRTYRKWGRCAQRWSAHTWTGRKIKEKLQELESRRSGSSDRGAKTTDVPAIKPTSVSQPASATPASSPSARLQLESAQEYDPALWQQRSEAASNALLPVSYSMMTPPGSGCDATVQNGYRALCAQCSVPLLWPGTAGSSDAGCNVWASLAGKTSGPFDEGYAVMNQVQWPEVGSVRGAGGSL